MAREHKGVVEVTVLPYSSDEDDVVEVDVLSESMIGGDDDDTNSHLSRRNTLGNERNRDPNSNKHVEWCGRTQEVVVKPNEKNKKMAESPWVVRAHGVSEARVHGVLCERTN